MHSDTRSTMFSGQTAVVTGGGRGIGAAIATTLARRGARVVIGDVGGHAEAFAERLQAEGSDTYAERLDVADRDSVAAFAAIVSAEFGPVSLLVNNAGVALPGAFGDAGADAAWDRTLAVNLTGMFNVSSAFLADLTQTSGSVVNMASVVAFSSGMTSIGYTASKGGVRSFTQKLARELGPAGVRVNAVAPGFVATDIHSSVDATDDRTSPESRLIEWHTPMRRWGTPEEIAEPVAFLLSPAASFISGVTMPIDGGYLVV